MEGIGQCSAFFGDCEVFKDDPSISRIKNAFYIPYGHATSGLYDIGRRIVLQGAHFSGPSLRLPQGGISAVRFSDIEEEVDCAIYAGFMHQHFGHFLLSFFSRLWPYARGILDRSIKIAVHTDEAGAAQYFHVRPWAKQLIAGIGLTEANFVTFERPTRFREVIVPAPSFEEGAYAHRVFSALGNMVGAKLSEIVPRGDDGPAYLSKQRLKAGVRKIENEDEVVGPLERRGVAIIFPETMSVSDQAAMWRDRRAVASFVSSGLHGAILAPGRSVVAVSDSKAIQSSFPLVDTVNGARGCYLGLDEDQIIHRKDSSPFQVISRLARPDKVADAILRGLDR